MARLAHPPVLREKGVHMLSTRNRLALCVGLLSAISLGAAAQTPYHFTALHGGLRRHRERPERP